MDLKIVTGFSENLTTLVVPMFQQSNLNNWLSVLGEALDIPEELLISDFKAEHKTTFTTFANGQRIVLLGLGDKIESQKIIEAFRSFSNNTKIKVFKRLALILSIFNLAILKPI